MSGGRKCLPALEDYYECLHHRKEVSPPHSTRSALSGENADWGLLWLGSEDKGTTARVQKSGSRTPERERAEGGDDPETRVVG